MSRMDPVTQSALGHLLPKRKATQIRYGPRNPGCIGGLAPDLDVLISSSEDPLLFLEYHRQFTHSLIFIPFGSLFVSFFAGNSLNTALVLKKCTYFVFLATQLMAY